MRKHKKSATQVLLASIVLTATMSMTVFAGEWQTNEFGWQYQQDDGTYAQWGWHWIDGRCYYFEDVYRMIDHPVCVLNGTADRYYAVDASGAWIYNGTIVEEGSKLAQKLTSDNFSGTYISTYLEEDSGNYTDNSYRIDISKTTDPNEPPLFYLTQYLKNADGSWERVNSAIEGTAGVSLDENGNTILIVNSIQTDVKIAQLTKNGDTLQITMDEGRITYQKQN